MRQTYLGLLWTVATTVCSPLLAGEPEAPEVARRHALAWRANLTSIKELTCEFRVWTTRVESLEDALAFRLGDACPDDTACNYAHSYAQGRLYIRGDYFLEFEKSDLFPEGIAFLKDDYKVRFRAFDLQSDGVYRRGGELATPNGPQWSGWQESHYTPHRLMSMGDRLSTRVDCEILRDLVGPDAPVRIAAWRVEETEDLLGHPCLAVAQETGGTADDRFVYTYYFDRQVPGLLWAASIENADQTWRSVGQVVDMARLDTGQWYPRKIISLRLDKQTKKILYDGHVQALEVTRLETKAPPLEEMKIRVRGDVWLTDYGKNAWAYLKEERTVRVDQLEKFAEELLAIHQQQAGVTAPTAFTTAPGAAPAAAGDAERHWQPRVYLGIAVVVLAATALGAYALRRLLAS